MLPARESVVLARTSSTNLVQKGLDLAHRGADRAGYGNGDLTKTTGSLYHILTPIASSMISSARSISSAVTVSGGVKVSTFPIVVLNESPASRAR